MLYDLSVFVIINVRKWKIALHISKIQSHNVTILSFWDMSKLSSGYTIYCPKTYWKFWRNNATLIKKSKKKLYILKWPCVNKLATLGVPSIWGCIAPIIWIYFLFCPLKLVKLQNKMFTNISSHCALYIVHFLSVAGLTAPKLFKQVKSWYNRKYILFLF